MQIKAEKETLIVTVEGELDHHIADKLRSKIENAFKGEMKNIVFDFSSLSFMDSSGIGMIMGRYKSVQKAGGTLIVTGAKPQIERILKISGLMTIVRTESSVGQALKKFKG